MINRIKTNIHLDGEIAGSSPDAQYDLYKTSDAQRDLNYYTSKLLDMVSALNGTALTEVILNTNGGKVTDSGGGQVDISKLYGIGLAVDGGIRPVYIPALTNVSLPSGWNDGRAIWVIAKHEFLTTGSTRNHAKYPAETYHYQVIDSYYGNADSTLLFTDSAPAAGTLILGKFTMTGTVFADLAVRSDEVDFYINKLDLNSRLVNNITNYKGSGSSSSNSKTIRNIISFSGDVTQNNKAIRIEMPMVASTSFHMTLKYSENTTMEVSTILITGFMDGTPNWSKVDTVINGNIKFLPKITFYKSATGKAVIVLGDNINFTDDQNRPEIEISELHVYYAGQTSSLWSDESNYKIDLVTSLAGDTLQIETIPLINRPNRGMKKGLRLKWQSATLPPTIEAGSIDVEGITVNLENDYNMTMADTILQNRHVFDNNTASQYHWFDVCVDRNGKFYYIPSYGRDVASTAITSISVTSNVATATVASTTGVSIGMVVPIIGNGGLNGVFHVVSIPDGTHFTFNCNIADGTYNGGTAYFKHAMSTLHGTGTAVHYESGANISIFSPRYKNVSDGGPTNGFMPPLNGYYTNINGYHSTTPLTKPSSQVLRIIGCFYLDGSGQVVNDMISYGEGYERNDNIINHPGLLINVSGSPSFVSTVIPFTPSGSKIWGNDYLATQDSTNKFKITFIKKTIVYNGKFNGLYNTPAGSQQYIEIYKNGASTGMAQSLSASTFTTAWCTNIADEYNTNDYIQWYAQPGTGNVSAGYIYIVFKVK